MFRRKYRKIKLQADDAVFLEKLATKRGQTVMALMSNLIEVMKEEDRLEDEMSAQKRAELEEQIRLLIPYLGEPDTIVDGEPGWTGIKYKRALKQYLLENDPEGYEEYREELENIE